MAPFVPVRSLALLEIPRRLQQIMWKNRANLEDAGIWEFLLWVRDVDKVAHEKNVSEFVNTYQLKNTKATVDGVSVDFSTHTISQVFRLSDSGEEVDSLPALTRAEAEEIFEYKIRWGKETKWGIGPARHHWSMWFEVVNNYFLLRLDDTKMEQRYVVAAVRAWQGHKVNWAHVIQQRINEEIVVRKAQSTSIMYLYSAFHITCLCEFALKPDEQIETRQSPTCNRFSPPSPTSEEIENQMHLLRKRILELTEQLAEKQRKLELAQEKNADYLQQLNQQLQEKLFDQRRSLELQNMNATLKLQLTERREDYARLHHEGSGRMVPGPIMVDRSCNTMECSLGDPSTSTLPVVPSHQVSTESKFLSDEVCAKFWDLEQRICLNFNLHQFYEIHRDLLLAMTGYELEAVLDRSQFFVMWSFCERFKVENLFVEVLARKHLRLSDPFAVFIKMGDIGGRIYLYYAECEERLQVRRGLRRLTEERQADWGDYSAVMSQQFYSPGREAVVQWRTNLEAIALLVKHEEFLEKVLSFSLRRVYNVAQIDDFTASHYLYNRENAIDRIDRYLKAIEGKRAPVLSVQAQVDFCLAPPGYCPRFVRTIDMPVGGSSTNQRYLGHYRELFDDETEMPIPTWSALAWILEDYRLSRTEKTAADLVYKQQSGSWSFEPPSAVQLHPQFCPCARRHKWAPGSTIASVEYNWPQIQGAPGFNTPSQCRDAYFRFFEEHRDHKDPVCFRAAIFCKALSEWCHKWNFAINVNHHHESRQEFFILMKLQFRPARWLRLLEAMALTHFIEGVHPSLINEFPFTRTGPFERFLKWQRVNNPHVVAQDEDMQRALLRLDAREIRQPTGSRSRALTREGEEDDTEGSVKRARIGRDANRKRKYTEIRAEKEKGGKKFYKQKKTRQKSSWART